MENHIYDLIIIGAGPAGLAASIYAARYKLDHLILGMELGGQLSEVPSIENYPGFPHISGSDLVGKFMEHLENLGMNIKRESVASIKKRDDGFFEVETGNGKYVSQTLIMAMGAEYKRMNIPGEKEFTGKGVSYCATCDAPFFKDKTVAVIGGGNSAAVVALELTDYAKKVYILYRDKLSADPIWIERMRANRKIEEVPQTQIIEIKGTEKVERILLDKCFNDKTFLEVDGVFIEIGSEPGIELARKLGVETDPQNYIKVKEDMSTDVPGIFAAGDITTGSNKFRQIITAAAEGAVAAASVYRKLRIK